MCWSDPETRNKKLEELYGKLCGKLSAECDAMGERIPYIPVNGRYPDMGEEAINWWTNGFWGGIMWQMYHAAGEEKYRAQAERLEERLEEAFAHFDKLDHDVGFMWLHTSVAHYRLTGDEKARQRGLRAASVLASRYCPKGEYIRAWNRKDSSEMIIDCVMNLPLLFWAAKEGKKEAYFDIAQSHLNSVLKYLVREDGSCNHIAEFDPGTGELLALPGGQGFEEGSAWSRGQAWAIYGLSLAYRYTREEKYLNAAKKVAHYFIANAALNGFVSLIDFRAPEEPTYLDTTATACAACGLLELAGWVGVYERPLYEKAAWQMLLALTEKFCDWSPDREGILQAGSAKYHRESDREVPIIYGDYFLTELVLRFRGQEFLIW